MKRSIIHTDKAPHAIGAYSQAVKVDNTVYISGQIALDPISLQLVSDDFVEQTQQVFANLAAIADAAGGALTDAVKLTVYLTDLNDFAALNRVMASMMFEPFPARAAVQVAALPKGSQVEIDAVLCLE